jgi:hypothetical protein
MDPKLEASKTRPNNNYQHLLNSRQLRMVVQ